MRAHSQYLNQIFKCTEYVNVCYNNVKEIGSRDVTRVVQPGRWVCVNPLQPHMTRRRRHLAAYRNFVIEFDNITVEEQVQLANRIKLPYATAVFSGNKSIHFVISLTTDITEAEYMGFASRIKTALPQCDASCLEPCRLTRMPTEVQPLLKIKQKVSPHMLDDWLTGMGVPPVVQGVPSAVHVVDTTRLTWRAMQYLAGRVESDSAHAAALHTAKNLFELGYSPAQVCEIMTRTRQIMMEESEEYSRERTKKVVDWVYHEWQEV